MSAILGKISSDAMVSVFEEAVSEAYRHGLNAGLANKLTEGTFEWAMQQMRQGKQARRNSACAFRLAGDKYQFRTYLTDWADDHNVAASDVLATDWQIVPDPKPEPEGHDFAWALEQMRGSYMVRRKAWNGSRGITGGSVISLLTADSIQAKDWVFA